MREVKIDHPIYNLLKQKIKGLSAIIIRLANMSATITISRSETDFGIILQTENGTKSKKCTFLGNSVVKIEAKPEIEECFEENPVVYLDALKFEIEGGTVILVAL